MGAIKHRYNGYVGIAAIAEAYGIGENALALRLHRGMSMRDAVSIPYRVTVGSINRKPTKRGIRYPYDMHPLWKLALGIGEAR